MNSTQAVLEDTPTAGLISLLIAFAIFTLCIPTLLAHDILPQKNNSYLIKSTTNLPTNFSIPDPDSITNKYTIGLSKTFVSNDCFLLKLNLWLTGILMKVIFAKSLNRF
ncbi:unnamed protein product [Onchocerca flexuosa]|uniref:Ovule protein n=1 Tax=Onchocerca flexuosa TaxID=387005 RepID=A0A183HVN6_9BILA|nr:unnamed protein product [Onchocerca flexuosa]